MSVAAVITILVTRGYLLATGYPQVGGEIFHIAHAVWGGLLLMIALTVVLSLANRWATAFASIAGGIGIGLFVDEIGKFSSRRTTTTSSLSPRPCATRFSRRSGWPRCGWARNGRPTLAITSTPRSNS